MIRLSSLIKKIILCVGTTKTHTNAALGKD